MPIYIVDQLLSNPGQVEKLFSAYMQDYVPGARKRGMTLENSLIEPPFIQRGDLKNRLTFIWTVPDVSAWYNMRFAAMADPAVTEFWRGLAPLFAHRERTFHESAINHV